MGQATKQVRVVSGVDAVAGQDFEPVAFFDENGDPVEIGGGGGGEAATWATLAGKPAVIAAGADQAAARAAIGAGTGSSNLALGTTATTALAGNTPLLAVGATATTAAAGNHVHAASVVTVAAGTGIVGANVQAVLADLAARVVALETP